MDKLIQRAIDFRSQLDNMLKTAQEIDPDIHSISFGRFWSCKDSTELSILKEKWKNFSVIFQDKKSADKKKAIEETKEEAKELLKETIVLAIYETLICRPYIRRLEVRDIGVSSIIDSKSRSIANRYKVKSHYSVMIPYSEIFGWRQGDKILIDDMLIKEALAEIASENQCDEYFRISPEGKTIRFL